MDVDNAFYVTIQLLVVYIFTQKHKNNVYIHTILHRRIKFS